MYYEWNEYKLKLDALRIIQLEDKLGGKSPLSIFSGIDQGQMPQIKDLLLVLHYALQPLQTGIKMEDTIKIYDQQIDNGFTIVKFIELIMEIYKVSGLIPKEVDSKN